MIAALPFLAGGAALAVAVSRLYRDIGRVYASDLDWRRGRMSAADSRPQHHLRPPAPCCLRRGFRLSAPGFFVPEGGRRRGVGWLVPVSRRGRRADRAGLAAVARHPRSEGTRSGAAPVQANGIRFRGSRCTTAEHQEWGLSETYTGPKPNSLFMDIDSSASTPILEGGPVTGPLSYLQYEITGLAYFDPALRRTR